jgi:hypothetical protein
MYTSDLPHHIGFGVMLAERAESVGAVGMQAQYNIMRPIPDPERSLRPPSPRPISTICPTTSSKIAKSDLESNTSNTNNEEAKNG